MPITSKILRISLVIHIILISTIYTNQKLNSLFGHNDLLMNQSKKINKKLNSILNNTKESLFEQDLKQIYNMFQVDLLSILYKQKSSDKGLGDNIITNR